MKIKWKRNMVNNWTFKIQFCIENKTNKMSHLTRCLNTKKHLAGLLNHKWPGPSCQLEQINKWNMMWIFNENWASRMRTSSYTCTYQQKVKIWLGGLEGSKECPHQLPTYLGYYLIWELVEPGYASCIRGGRMF